MGYPAHLLSPLPRGERRSAIVAVDPNLRIDIDSLRSRVIRALELSNHTLDSHKGVSGPENHKSGRERRTVLLSSEFQPSSDEAHFPAYCVIVPPCRIGACRNKTDYCCAAFRALVCLAHPVSDLPTIRWIHPANAAPFFCESVLFRREVPGAFRIFGKCANVKFKTKFKGQLVEEILRRGPYVCL